MDKNISNLDNNSKEILKSLLIHFKSYEIKSAKDIPKKFKNFVDETLFKEYDCIFCVPYESFGNKGKFHNYAFTNDGKKYLIVTNRKKLIPVNCFFSQYNPNNQSCFIATEIYGNANHPNVEALRNYRDEVLSKTKFGKIFINFYYSGFGEKTAELINRKMAFLKRPIKKCLDKIVENYSNAY